MSFHHQPRIVTDGLDFYVDAGNPKSYNRDSSIWKDLSGNNYDGSINIASFDNNSFYFPGDNKNYVSTNYAELSTDFTLSIWFKDDGVIRTFERLADKQYNSGWWLGRYNNVANQWGGGIQEDSNPYGIYLTLIDGIWHNIVSIRSGTTHILYGDGITNTISNSVSDNPLSSVKMAIGNWNTLNNSQSYRGNIAIVKYYNRALSPSEVLQNYNALKSRFI